MSKEEIFKLQYWVASLISVLFFMNGFFIKRLVDKIDSLESIVYSLRQEVAVMHATMEVANEKRH